MKTWFGIVLILAALPWMGVGCITTEQVGPPPASQADVGYLREELRRLNDRLDATENQFGHLQGDLASRQATQPAYATTAQVQSLQTQLERLQVQIRALDAARGQDKKEIYNDISKKIATIAQRLESSASASSQAVRATSGWEHVVKSGETLSQIAAAYKVKMADIVKANNLKSIDAPIFVGQKLFIPD